MGVMTYVIKTGSRHDATGSHWWIDGKEVSRNEFRDYMHWLSPDFIWQELMKTHCVNCHALYDDCRCCPGCGQIDADVIGTHGYGCVA